MGSNLTDHNIGKAVRLAQLMGGGDDRESDALLGLLKADRECDPSRPFWPFAQTVCRNHILMGMRKSARWLRRSELATDPATEDQHACDAADWMAWARRGLCWPHRLLLVLLFEEGMSLEDVAEILGEPFLRVKYRRTEALRRMRKLRGWSHERSVPHRRRKDQPSAIATCPVVECGR